MCAVHLSFTFHNSLTFKTLPIDTGAVLTLRHPRIRLVKMLKVKGERSGKGVRKGGSTIDQKKWGHFSSIVRFIEVEGTVRYVYCLLKSINSP